MLFDQSYVIHYFIISNPSFHPTSQLTSLLSSSSCSVVSVLFIFSLLVKTNSQPKPRSVFLGYSSLQRGYQCYSPDINSYFISTDVTFYEGSFFFSSTARPPISDVLYIPLVLPSLGFPSPSTDDVTRPLQVYTRYPHPPTRPLADSSSMLPPSSPAPAPQPTDDLPIAIRKGTLSKCNPHPIYNFLSFHRLSLPYFAFVSTLSSVSNPKSTSEALSHLGWKQVMVEEIDVLYSNGTWELVALPPSKSPIGCR